MSINLKTLISKLDDTCRLAAERAANLCMSRGNYEVDLEHLFLALLEQPQSDFVLIARRCGIAPEALERDLSDEISQFKTGNSRTPVFSQHIPKLFEHAWLIASLDSETSRIRSGHLLLALMTEPELSQLAYRGSKLFVRFKVDALKHDFAKLTEGSQEAGQTVRNADAGAGEGDLGGETAAAVDGQKGGLSKTPALDQFTTNLTERAREDRIDPVIGRDAEIRQVIDILMRRRQNNPILTGEAGVGKTAVVEGLARRIAGKDVPDVLLGVELHTLDMGLLQAGASVKGEFENRLKNVIDEVKKSPHPIILFIDEAHTMIGAGGTAGQNDAANLLKPALARGELRTIAATTWSEYKKYFEKDAALARRFQVVKVEEPTEALAAAMLRGMVGLMEAHFNIRVMDEAVTEAVRLSHRYISGRQLPDKAVSVLDTACAKVALGQRLFNDPQLSRSGQIACASCHERDLAFADGRRVSFGHDRQAGRRNAPSVAMSGHLQPLFWDGRAATLEDQALLPIADPKEMAFSADAAAARLRGDATYRRAFAAVFGNDRIETRQLAQAIAAFERSLAPPPSRLDRFISGRHDQLDDQQLQGLHLFRTRARCMNCHSGPALTDHGFHNLGLHFHGGRRQDLGRYEVTGDPADSGRFRTPSLRGVARTAPYMHNGAIARLDAVLQFYNVGGGKPRPRTGSGAHGPFPAPDPQLQPLQLTRDELQAIQAFLQTL